MPEATVVNFKEDCVDPLAKLVLLEAMSFAVEKAESRLDSLGKIFPGLEAIGEPIIRDIKDIRLSIEKLNVCSIGTSAGPSILPPSEPPPAAFIKTFPKQEQELIKEMPAALQTALAQELERKRTGGPVEPADFYVKGSVVTATKEQKKKVAESPEEKKERTQPTSWVALEYQGQSYSSPGFFLSQLHGGDVKAIRGKGNYLKQLEAEGFDVYAGDKLIPANLKPEEVEKLKEVLRASNGTLRVEPKKGKGSPAPSGGTAPGPAEPGPSDITKLQLTARIPITSFPTPWTVVNDASGKMLFVEDANKKPLPETVWRQFTSKDLNKLAPNTRKI